MSLAFIMAAFVLTCLLHDSFSVDSVIGAILEGTFPPEVHEFGFE